MKNLEAEVNTVVEKEGHIIYFCVCVCVVFMGIETSKMDRNKVSPK